MFGGASGRRLEHLIKFLKAGKSVDYVSKFCDVNPAFVEEMAKIHAPKKKPVKKAKK